MSAPAARWWHTLEDGRIQCDLCPRDCRLADGQRGLCFVRQRQGQGAEMMLTTYGRSSAFCIDPIRRGDAPAEEQHSASRQGSCKTCVLNHRRAGFSQGRGRP